MPFDPLSPHYLRIRDEIARDISAGTPPANEKFPSERDMIERFGCTRVTLRQALQQLEAEGLVYRENRRGWFVSPQRIRYDPTRISGSWITSVPRAARRARNACTPRCVRRVGGWLNGWGCSQQTSRCSSSSGDAGLTAGRCCLSSTRFW